ncbi:hypothetical protein P280DRAFT_409422 [Massarina eburnea CBS 473.64]|uniref:Heterokaryon incompatibility domain-containing protein n=1 Tax=Massarina eburnea CBS 473.64 TaxID=1395130 RepID=A0A6A6RQN2_9PLEO|nr:hypothetical protein P280DRAFT_409422 [Massarina eburnea CBS 473.64]
MDVTLKRPTRENCPYRDKVNGSSIRLLRISRSLDGCLAGFLKVFPLADAPPFYSASYTWGEQTSSNTRIWFKSGSLPVLPNLVPFLRMITEHEDFNDGDWWWIDSLCINLADSREREQQVRIMANIYKKSRRAVVWLGEEKYEGDNCTGAIEFMLHLSTLSLAFEHQNVRRNLRGPNFTLEWASVGNMLARPWWSRVWTLQEFVLPKEAKLYCGSRGISRGKFKGAMYNIFLCSKETQNHDIDRDLIPRPVFDAAFNRRRIHQWYSYPHSRGMSLVAILAYLGNQSASDSRDRIYSVLGLMTERDRSVVGNPEYTTSVQQQFAKLVRSFWDEYHSLDIICFSHLFSRYSGTVDLGPNAAVPSWTPDWRVHTEFASPVPLMASQSASEHVGNFRSLHSAKWTAMYDAPGPELRQHADVRFDVNLTEIMCDGVIIDTIDTLGALEGCHPRCKSFVCANDKRVHGIIHNAQYITDAYSLDSLELLDAIARSLVLDRQDKYLRFEAPEKYVSEFLALCRACMEGDSSIHAIFSTWFEQNRGLRFGDYTLETLITTITSDTTSTFVKSLPLPTRHLESPSAFPSPNAEYDDTDAFLSRFLDTVKKKSRRLMVTTDGYVGMAPCRARLSDVVVILFGCSIPLVLRRVGRAGRREMWQVVGEAYIHGFMNGEINKRVQEDEMEVHRFKLI